MVLLPFAPFPLVVPQPTTETRIVPHRTSISISIARRFLATTTIPSMPNGKIEARIGRGPCLSPAVLVMFPLPLPATVTVTVVDGIDVPSMGSEVGANAQVIPVGTVHVRVNV